MKVMMLVLMEKVDPGDVGDDVPDIDRWVEDNDSSGVRVMGERRSASQARTVRVRRGELIVTDAPFAKAHQAIAGFDILESCARRRGRGRAPHGIRGSARAAGVLAIRTRR